MKIKVYFADCQKELTSIKPKIEQVAEEVAKITSTELDLPYNLDLIVTNRMPLEIPPEESFGIVYSNHTNAITQLSDAKTSLQNVAFELLMDIYYKYHGDCIKDHLTQYHLSHALFDNGLALAYALEHCPDISKLSEMKRIIINREESNNLQALHKMGERLFSADYDHWRLFYESDVSKNEKFIGFSLGLSLVQKYLTDTNQTLAQAVHNPYQQFDDWLVAKISP